MHVCVIGAGVVGVASAYALARAGHAVTLVDGNAAPAEGASHANGGQLSYSYVAPLAGPGVLPQVPGWLLRHDSPLRFTPRLDPHQWRWALAFVHACRASVADATTAEMLRLAYLSRDVLHAWQADAPFDFDHQRNGKLIAYRSPALLDKARKLVAYQAQQGSDQRVLDAGQTVALEPALRGMGATLAGAIHTPSEEVGDCARYTQGLFDALASLPGTQRLMRTAVHRLRVQDKRVQAVETAQGDVTADAYVVAAGMGSRALLSPLGVDVPLYPLKGYSLTVDVAPGDDTAPAISVTDYERRIVYARIGQRLRIAAMVDMGARDASVDPGRIALLKRQVSEAFPQLDLSAARAWAGLRPATPTGRPRIGQAPGHANLWMNLGQGALGFTLACGSATLLERLMAGRAPAIDPAAFRP